MVYCENCFEDNLKNYVSDNIGSLFCSRKCLKEFEIIKKENRIESKAIMKIIKENLKKNGKL